MISPCDKTKAGESVDSIAKAHIENTTCIKQHKQLLQSQKDWKAKQQQIYNK